MRGKEMLDALGYVSPALIEKGEKTMKRQNIQRFAAIAASICLIVCGLFLHFESRSQYGTEKLSVSDTDVGMGFEVYVAHDISELLRDDPADGKRIKALTVYRNTISYDERLYPYGQDLDAMREYLLEIAAKFGLDIDTVEIEDNRPGEGQMQGLIAEFASRGLEVPEYYKLPYRLWIRTEKLEISVDADMTATVTFIEKIPLPSEYNFDFTSTPEELAEAGEYLWEQYGYLVDYEKPTMRINGGDYNIYEEQNYQLAFYEGSRDKYEDFENYSFNYVEFYPYSNGELRMIRIFSDKAVENIGKYPLISEKEAKALLLEGKYYTTVTEEFPGENAVVRCELMYRAGSKDKILMPFYRFYVYLENSPSVSVYPEGYKAYGAYYVPAVDPSYLEE